MPNHVSSNLTITGPGDDVRRFVSAVDRSAGGSKIVGEELDFAALVPMPKELVGRNQKWGAYDTGGWEVTDCSTSGMTTATISYNTAWSPATPFFERVSLMYPTLVFDTEYADEGGGFVGATSFENGEIMDHDYEWDSQEGIAVRESVGYGPWDEDEDEDVVVTE
jgi:hypothetical protein